MNRVFLDANVFLHALGDDSTCRQACVNVLEAAVQGRLDAVTSTEVLQEVLHMRIRRGDPEGGIAGVRMALEVVSETLPVEKDAVLAACKILEAHPQLSVRDAFHVAVMKTANIHAIISTDPDFDAVREIRRIDPKDAV